ncbi:MAG: tetratricopeptide repeat protein [Acidobacteriota bacterium]|nr:tetratricopeptide repeat protein [Acidobacteriota bacterium]
MTTTTPRLYTAVILFLVLFFVGTTFLARSYRSERQTRADYHFSLGQKLAAEGHQAEALEQYRTALSLEPGTPRFQLAIALVLVDLGRLDNAESHLQDLLQADPTNGLLNLTMARVSAREGLVDDAITYYHRAIYGLWTTRPVQNRIDARFELVDYIARNGTHQQLVAELVQLQSDLPDEPALKQRVAGLFLSASSPRQAAALYRDVARAQPRNAAAYAGLGESLFALEDYQGAQAVFRRAILLHAADPDLKARLVWVNQYLGLDPLAPRLATAERYRRSQRLVDLTLASLSACLDRTQSAALSDPMQKLIDAAQKLLSSHQRIRNYDQAADDSLSISEQLWRAKQASCPEAPGTGTPLAALMTRLTQQAPATSN